MGRPYRHRTGENATRALKICDFLPIGALYTCGIIATAYPSSLGKRIIHSL